MVDEYPHHAKPLIIDLRPSRVEALLGIDLGAEEIARSLRALELSVVEPARADLLHVTCPTVRIDLEREVDLIEEVARLHGFEDIPATLPALRSAPLAAADTREDLVRRAFAGAGLDETIGFGFASPARIAALRLPADHPVARPLSVENPMREEQSVMRTSLLANLLAMVAHNQAFGIEDVRLFEIGSIFLRGKPGSQLPDEPRFTAAVIAGSRAGWLKAAGSVDFYDLKGIVERVFAELRLAVEFMPARREDGFLHPGVAAGIVAGGVRVGVLGEVHPETRDRFGIGKPCYAVEINLEAISPPTAAQFSALARFPASLRDVSFFVDDFVPAAHVRAVVDGGRPRLLEELRIVEDYREAGKVPVGKKGMLWSMTYRDPSRTLTDAEVDAVHEELVARMLQELRGVRR